MGDTLCHAMSAARSQDHLDEALIYANNALALIESSSRWTAEPTSGGSDCFVGTLYFAVGSIHSAGKNDHLAAVRSFEKALPRFANLTTDMAVVDIGQHGERLVSMGVSYWQTGNQEQGMKLTMNPQGAQWIEQAVKTGGIPEKSLAIPYSNLASMHQQMGNKDESRSFAALAKKFEKPTK